MVTLLLSGSGVAMILLCGIFFYMVDCWSSIIIRGSKGHIQIWLLPYYWRRIIEIQESYVEYGCVHKICLFRCVSEIYIVILKNHQRSLSFIIIIIISTYFLNICIMQIHVACNHACHACAPLNIFPYATCMNIVAYYMRICLQCCIMHTLFVQLIHLLHMLHCCIAPKQAIAFVKSQSLKRSRNETF